MDAVIPQIFHTTSRLTRSDHLDHWLARWAINREGHRVQPGLYALGDPTPASPVFVSANYTLSFDALREALAGLHAWILVLDTKGINVWCAAGKGTFGTQELIERVNVTRLADQVSHRKLILPQLGAPGVAAHEVTRATGFHVEYGPVRAEDLPEYLNAGKASARMREVKFPFMDRLVLIPVELVVLIPFLLVAALIRSVPAVVALLTGVAVFPLLLPYLPTRNFSSKGWLLGLIAQIPFALAELLAPGGLQAAGILQAAGVLLVFPPISAFLALNFTGSSTFTSRTGGET